MSAFVARGGAKYPDTTPPPQWVTDVVPQDELMQTKKQPTAKTKLETDTCSAAFRGGKYHIPGYTGYIPNGEDVAGRTFARATRRALNHDAKDIVIGDTIPSDPQATHKPLVEDESLRETFVGKEMSRPKHIEGYTGHVPGAREEPLGITFGRYSEQVLRRPMDAKEDRKVLKSQPQAGFSYNRPRPKPKLDVPDKGLDLRYNTG